MEAYMSLPNYLFYFLFTKETETFFLATFAIFYSSHFWIFNPGLVGCFVNLIKNGQRPNVISTLSIYETLGKKKELETFGQQEVLCNG